MRTQIGGERGRGALGIGLVVAVFGLVSCGSSSSQPRSASPPTREAMCENATRLFLVSADPASPSEALDERAPSLLQQVMAAPQAREVLPQLKQVEAIMGLDRSEYASHEAEIKSAVGVLDELLVWTNDTCQPGLPAWACTSRRKFEAVGRVPDESPTEPGQDSATADPSEAEIGRGPEGTTRSELSRTGDRVVLVWRRDDGLVLQRRTMERDTRGWNAAETSSCP